VAWCLARLRVDENGGKREQPRRAGDVTGLGNIFFQGSDGKAFECPFLAPSVRGCGRKYQPSCAAASRLYDRVVRGRRVELVRVRVQGLTNVSSRQPSLLPAPARTLRGTMKTTGSIRCTPGPFLPTCTCALALSARPATEPTPANQSNGTVSFFFKCR
jgi:hypothetical protein